MWFVGVPALVAIVILLPFVHHLALNSVIVVVSGLGAIELAKLFARKDAHYRSSIVVIPLLGAAIPLAQVLTTTFGLSESIPYTVLVGVAGIILFIQVFRHTAEDFHHTLSNIAANLTILVYPGLFLSYIIRLNEFESSSVLILTFFCMVVFNDSMAYIAGGLYRLIRQGRARRRGSEWKPKYVFPVSPKKTVVGFVAGFLMAPAVLVSSDALFPNVIPGNWVTAILIGCAVGAATIVGDLIESAIKRSATSKDSGELIPGRGGILDSVDSVLYAVPVFYYLLRYIV
jgi:phosphatidate cytidylyltransferase